MFQDVPHDVLDRWVGYLNAPTPAHFLQLREAVAGSPAFDPASDLIAEVEASLTQGSVHLAMEQMREAMPNYLLCPHLHNMASTAYFSLHDSERSDLERRVSLRLCQSLIETGDGTAQYPYLVLHARDREDLLEQLQLQADRQRTEQSGGRHFTVCECEGGADLWFDVTASYQAHPA
jgi:hypothetical protein